MQESKFLGTFLPSHPHFLPIEQKLRKKCALPQLSPDDAPITIVNNFWSRYKRDLLT
jgi:hypothetical protein